MSHMYTPATTHIHNTIIQQSLLIAGPIPHPPVLVLALYSIQGMYPRDTPRTTPNWYMQGIHVQA